MEAVQRKKDSATVTDFLFLSFLPFFFLSFFPSCKKMRFNSISPQLSWATVRSYPWSPCVQNVNQTWKPGEETQLCVKPCHIRGAWQSHQTYRVLFFLKEKVWLWSSFLLCNKYSFTKQVASVSVTTESPKWIAFRLVHNGSWEKARESKAIGRALLWWKVL